MTNHWNDLQHADATLIIGANPAENHPISMRWLLKARERGGKIISVDPRYTRSSQMADIYAQLRSGTDIAFIGGLINYAIEHNLVHRDYVAKYTNAAFILNDEYDFNDGLFSGYNEETRKYDQSTWSFKRDEEGNILKDETLNDPRCVYQLIKKHYSRYDIDSVCAVTGTPKELYEKVAATFCATGAAEKTGTIMYAMGTTQHTVGTQNVRSYAILQMLLGNIGRPGGGVNALRGESNVQGSTDFALLFDNLPGYLGAPYVDKHPTLQAYHDIETPKGGYWKNKPKFVVSLLKAFYGPNATAENEFGYHYLPKMQKGKNYSHISLFEALYNEEIKGMFLFGQNPVVGGPNANKEQNSLANLDWMVAVDLWETETSSFWSKQAGSNPADIKTEVFFLPACGSYEKEGTITNSGRWMQYRWQAIEPKGESKADLEIVYELGKRLKALYKNQNTALAAPINAITWEYGDDHGHPEIDLLHREINGYNTQTGQLVKSFAALADDGTTCSGNWIYSGFYPAEGKNLSKARDNKDTGMGNFLNWSYAWPLNRRIIYNRCSADWTGKPWAKGKEVIWWDESKKEWTGYDVPDFVKTKAPSDPGGTNAFIMTGDEVGGIFAGRNDGPLPEHYEPYESPIPNPFNSQDFNPAIKIWGEKENKKGSSKDFPIVATTYRLTEHWQSGAMTRNQSLLSELVAHMFVEMSEELAKEKGINNKDKIIINSARGEIEAYAMVTKRFKPYTIKGQIVHHVGLPWHFGYNGIVTGGTANRLTSHIGDANTMIPEYKAFLCNVRRA